MEPIFEAVLANDPSRITLAEAAQRMDEEIFVAELPHQLYRGDTPLHLAAAGLRYDAARALLAAGAPVNAVNRRGATALHYACDPRPLSPAWDPAAQRRVIDLLVSSGAAVDQPDRGGVTPLHRAVRARSPAAIAALLSVGANPRAATKKAGSTPLHLAVAPTGASGTAGASDLQLEIVQLLLAAGATLADVDRNGIPVADRIQSQALSGIGYPADGCRATGDPLIARDAYGSRFLVVAPFGYDGAAPDHWYAWDIDACWVLNVVGGGVFGTAEDALAEWQHAVGPAAGTALSPDASETTAGLLASCLKTGPLSDMLEGSEPPELIREYYRLRRRARVLVGVTAASAAEASPGGDDSDPVHEAFLDWYQARHDDVPQDAPDAADAADLIRYEWGPGAHPEERSRYSCSPHRIEMTAQLIRDGYFPDAANAALRLLPEWTQWCIEQSGLGGGFAARSRAAALTEAAALVDEEARGPAVRRNEAPFRRPE